MSLYFATERADGPGMVRDRIAKLTETSKHPKAIVLASRFEGLGPPHAIYEVRVQDILAGKTLRDCVRRRGERYLAYIAGEPAAAAEIFRNANGPGRHYVDINIGSFIHSSATAFKYLEANDELQSGSFEVSYLRCRLTFMEAIWLKAKNKSEDLIYPMQQGAPLPLQADQLYPFATFESIFQAIVFERFINISA